MHDENCSKRNYLKLKTVDTFVVSKMGDMFKRKKNFVSPEIDKLTGFEPSTNDASYIVL